MSSKVIFSVLAILLIFTRFFGLNWGGGYFFHPDENNMASSLSQLSFQNPDPHFYAYGQFPLYLGYISLKLVGLDNNFPNSIYILRFWSAIFSIASVYFFYQIYKNKIFLLFLIFTPGLIQLSHFGTTESLLILVFSICLYLSIYYPKKFFIYSLVLGIGIASKISSLIFFVPFIIANYKKPLLIIYTLILTALIAIILSPYNLINFADFKSAMTYETSVANGSLPVFYTQQFKNSLPYIFQFTHVFPYIAGLPIFTISFFALFLIHKSCVLNHKSIILAVSSIVYFIYFGQLYVKWTRFMSPLFFIFPLLAAIVISHQNKYLKNFLTLISIIPGVIFFSQYFATDIRLQALSWMSSNLPVQSHILSESGNVVNLPLQNNSFSINNYDFYNPVENLASAIHQADYILVPSRRVFKNYDLKYHQSLFNGSLGFTPVHIFSPVKDLLLNQENAEETWSVFDRPTIRLYQKNILFTSDEYSSKI